MTGMASHDEPTDVVGRITLGELDRSATNEVRTHVSTLVFAGDLVHKLKNDVRFPFVDLSTVEAREQICRREVEINRRFSPDVYLGVEEVIDDKGNVVDHAVLMRRLPADRRLATIVLGDADARPCVEAIARIMAASHAAAGRGPAIDAVATAGEVLELWDRNLDGMSSFAGSPLEPELLDACRTLAHEYVIGRAALFDHRIACRSIVDGHGDLLAEDIFCLDDGPRILDALEFDDRLRWGDVILDIAFLAMDLERLGRNDLAQHLWRAYRHHSNERHPASLEHLYVGYRASVRAKIACLRGGADAEASADLDLCHRHLLRGRVRLILVGGLPGTGKSTIAGLLATALGAVVLRTDETRKEVAGVDGRQHAYGDYRQGIYTEAMTSATYATILDRAGLLLGHGESVVIDASFSDDSWRRAAARAARRYGGQLVQIRCELPPDVAAERITRRSMLGTDVSDATPGIAASMANVFDVWPEAVSVDTTQPSEHVVVGLVRRILDDGRPAP